MAILNDERKAELLTPIERAWLDLLRTAMAASTSGAITFQEVNVRDGRAWAMRLKRGACRSVVSQRIPREPVQLAGGKRISKVAAFSVLATLQ